MLVERANDQNVDIRLEIVSAMPAMFERTDEPDILAEALEKRLRDHNEDVRQQAVISACAVGRSTPEKVTAELMASVGLRIRDKSVRVLQSTSSSTVARVERVGRRRYRRAAITGREGEMREKREEE